MNFLFSFHRLIIIIFSCFTILSCALIQPSPEQLDKDVKQWLAHNQFDEIDAAFSRINKNDKKFKSILSKQTSIEKQKKIFIEKTSATAKEHSRANKWQQALNAYNNALLKIKNQPRLTQERENLLKARDKHVKKLKEEMLIKRANALISYMKIYEKLEDLIPQDYSAQFDINRYDQDRIEVAKRLNICATQAIKNKQYITARNCYSLSYKLEPSKHKLLWVTKIDRQLETKSSKKRHDKLLAAYKTAYAKQQYNKAMLHLDTLLAINPSHQNAVKLKKSLIKEINIQTRKNIELGKELYAKKKIDKALNIWNKARLLEPDNKELLKLILRAETVSKKIQSLEKNQ
ncbi:hypothetical protein MNBD_GAMMA08-2994 [hydrothermal vent metagenome]|uniref:Tetratricopeptide repeat protein n=1 Tax=hydrothermal vent metagenome TaxID=652676 RepID=A0A3B0XPZ6_9ZZZZ